MALRLGTALHGHLGELRVEPTAKRIRARVAGMTIADSTRAMLVWEPRRIVPAYALPSGDITAVLAPCTPPAGDHPAVGAAVLDPSNPFAVHTAPGEAVDVILPGDAGALSGAGFRPDDRDLDGYVLLDFAAFDWVEEDEPAVAHPKDPFHRIDVLHSSRHVRIELDGEVLAESSRPLLLVETGLPARLYLPRDDVRVALIPSSTHTVCAYKGEASYWSAAVSGRTVGDLAWSYPHPLHEAEAVTGHICFFDEHVDVALDGVPRDRPLTPWSGPRTVGS